MSEWTPTPWENSGKLLSADSAYEITSDGPFWIAHVRTEEDAARIVTCVNGFDALVEALTEAVASFEQLVKLNRIPENMKGLRVARAALASVLPPSTSNPEGK